MYTGKQFSNRSDVLPVICLPSSQKQHNCESACVCECVCVCVCVCVSVSVSVCVWGGGGSVNYLFDFDFCFVLSETGAYASSVENVRVC